MSTASSVTRIDGSHPTRLNKEADIGKPPPLLRGVYGPYVLLPLIAALVWLGGLAALMGIWAAAGTPRYEEDSAGIAYISNVGAYHQTLFICICAVTAFFYISSLLTERWLRHVDRIPAHGVRNRRVVIYDLCAIIFCCIGSAALVVLSAFNCYSYPTVHWVGTGVFVLCVAISAVFQTLEILALKKDHPDRSHLLRNAVLKLIIVTLAICMAITFGVLYGLGKKNDINSPNPAEAAKGNRLTSAAAVLEWSIALVLDAYFFTLVLDLWPASKSSPRYIRRMARWEGQALEKLGLEPGVLPSVVPPTGAERNGRFEGLEQDAQTGGPAMTSAYVHPVTGYPSATNGGFPADTNGAFLPDPATTMTPASYPAVSERQPSAVFSPAGGPVSHFPTAAHPAGSDAPPVTAAAASSPAYQPQGADIELAPPLETMYSQTTGSVARY